MPVESSPESPRVEDVAAIIDHTLLRPEATAAQVVELIAEAARLGVYSVCVSPSMLPLPGEVPEGLRVAAVCGFPSGAHDASTKAAEAALAVSRGADEIDMVINLALAVGEPDRRLTEEIAAVRLAVPAPTVLKVIIESAALTPEQIVFASESALAAGADFIKTSTGFHPAGGASLEAVRLMSETARGRAGIKASGGVRTLEQARAFMAAGATRLGVSGSAALLADTATPAPGY